MAVFSFTEAMFMSPEQISEAISIANEFGTFSADERAILIKVEASSPLLAPWGNNPAPLAVVRSLFLKLAALTTRPAVA